MSAQLQAASSRSVPGLNRLRLAGLLAMLVLITAFVVYAATFRSMEEIWRNSHTFMHGYLVLPVCIYLVWAERQRLRLIEPQPFFGGIVLVVAAVLIWVVGIFADLQVGKQLAFVAMIAAALWCVLGSPMMKVLRFPMAFAFFSVPVGEFLIPPLMTWTAMFTVWSVNLTGIPVYLEGKFFSLPSGDFEVVAACSGVRYLIVTVVLGTLFAWFNYRSAAKRVLFVIGTAGAVIVANGVRAYIIVILAHLSEMQYGAGKEHVVIGWVVFLIVLTIAFVIGSRFADEPAPATTVNEIAARRDNSGNGKTGLLVAFVLVELAILAGPVLVEMRREAVGLVTSHPTLPVAGVNWNGPLEQEILYSPNISGADHVLGGVYEGMDAKVELHIVFFSSQEQGRELISSANEIASGGDWRAVDYPQISPFVVPQNQSVSVNSVVLGDGLKRLLLIYWYDIGGIAANSRPEAKLFRAWNLLTGPDKGDALLVAAIEFDNLRMDRAVNILEQFVADHLPAIKGCLRVPAGDAIAGCHGTD